MSNLTVRVAHMPEELLEIEKIRRVVFQAEQGVEQDLDFDGLDEICDQLIAYLNGECVGTARIRYLDEKTAKIERLAVSGIARGQGIGNKITEKALEVIASKNIPEVLINAQEYVKGLYQKIGFQQEGEVFEEAGILHVTMRKNLIC